jgi:hypothetical protein
MTAAFNSPHIGLVVEGPGDANSLPILLRKWLALREDYRDLLGKPIPCNGRENATVLNGIEGYTATAASRPGCKAVLVVLDAEKDCAAHMGPTLLSRAIEVCPVPVILCLAEHHWEDWLYASAETLEIDGFTYEEGKRKALSLALRPTKYVKPTWQPRLTARMNVELAISRSKSLARMLKKFDSLIPLIE